MSLVLGLVKGRKIKTKGKVALQKAGVMACFEGASMDAGVFQGAAEAADEAVLAKLHSNMPKAELR